MDKLIEELLSFMDSAPTAWHAVDQAKNMLNSASFTELDEGKPWNLVPGKGYYAVRNGSALCAFILPKNKPKRVHIAAAHTDSPSLKIKPRGEYRKENLLMLGVEVYGGPLLTSWLNRDLGIAGRVVYLGKEGSIQSANIAIDDAPVVIPQLAIHLDREVNTTGLLLNKQTHLSALAAIDYPDGSYLEDMLKKKIAYDKLLSRELFLYPLEKARLLGPNSELLSSYRFDNLGSVHAALTGLLSSVVPADETIKMAALWDNEEVGSDTAQGAASPFFSAIAERILLNFGASREDFFIFLHNSLCLSIDQAHALHPNYSEKHDPQHQPLLGGGIVIKSNAQQRYATDGLGEAFVKRLCLREEIPYQSFVSRGDIPCGSTIGPIHATTTGMRTVDIGCPQLSMHSSRELAAVKDHLMMCKAVQGFFKEPFSV